MGESFVESMQKGVGGTYQPAAIWSTRVTSKVIAQPVTSTDPGAGAVSQAFTLVTGVPSSDDPTRRDLATVDSALPVLSNPDIMGSALNVASLGLGALDAHSPAVSVRGALAFVGTDSAGPGVFVIEAKGAPQKVAPLGALCPGSRPAFAPSGTKLAYVRPVGSDCAATELRTISVTQGGSFVGGSDGLVAASPAGSSFESPSWRAKTPAARSTRLTGTDTIGTSIRTSRFLFPEPDMAPSVVVASSEVLGESVVAGPLAAQTFSPLLLTTRGSLDYRVRTEIKRALPPGATVYLVGGSYSLSTKVRDTVVADGFRVVRIAGADRYGTSVKVAQTLDSYWSRVGLPFPRRTAMIASAANTSDPLIAGPAASTLFAPVLLTQGTTMPSSVKAYLDARKSITKVYSIGASARVAGATLGSRHVPVTYGSTSSSTARHVARQFWPGAPVVGIANPGKVQETIVASGLMGACWCPLLLTSATVTSTPARAATEELRSGVDEVVTVGPTTSVSDLVRAEVRKAAGQQNVFWGPDVSLSFPYPTAQVTADGAGSATGRAADLRVDTWIERMRLRVAGSSRSAGVLIP